ncbi:hypothetical protein S40288_08043 [Stachybotrys chartarum IBT 40288]|nr:hypothetical protein S40288_08043 [Stachybotrys chartarum IBT 40288]
MKSNGANTQGKAAAANRLSALDMAESGWIQWTIILVLTALSLSLVVLVQIASAYSAAYMSAPKEVATFIDTVDFSVQENESYDRDVSKVQRLEDKIRLGRLLREIQKGGDDLREELNGLMISEGGTMLRMSARLLWASKRTQLEDRVRRLDLLRMRFLVVSLEKMSAYSTPIKPSLQKALTDSIIKRPPLRRLTTHAIGHQEHVARPHRKGWAGVVQELQTSPRMHQRHASIEQAMSRSPSVS